MSNGEGMFGSGPGRSAHDPFAGVLMAMREAWLAGIGFRDNMSAQSAPFSNPGAGLPAARLLGHMMGALGAMADFAAAGRQRFDQPNAEAQMASPPNRSVSYWIGLAQILESHQAKLAQVVATNGVASGSDRLVAADELRALLREAGDLAVREARILQSELDHLDESLVQAFQQTDPSGSYRRRWRSKI